MKIKSIFDFSGSAFTKFGGSGSAYDQNGSTSLLNKNDNIYKTEAQEIIFIDKHETNLHVRLQYIYAFLIKHKSMLQRNYIKKIMIKY